MQGTFENDGMPADGVDGAAARKPIALLMPATNKRKALYRRPIKALSYALPAYEHPPPEEEVPRRMRRKHACPPCPLSTCSRRCTGTDERAWKCFSRRVQCELNAG